jgi:hypothetical protein
VDGWGLSPGRALQMLGHNPLPQGLGWGGPGAVGAEIVHPNSF